MVSVIQKTWDELVDPRDKRHTPAEHIDGQHLRTQFLHDQVRRHAKYDIGDREHRDGDVVVVVFHVEGLGHPCDFRIS